jgi:hypothetical protein
MSHPKKQKGRDFLGPPLLLLLINIQTLPGVCIAFKNGGEKEIRTLDTLLAYAPLARECLRPLGHLSVEMVEYRSLKLSAP